MTALKIFITASANDKFIRKQQINASFKLKMAVLKYELNR